MNFPKYGRRRTAASATGKMKERILRAIGFFLRRQGGEIVGYLFGKKVRAEKTSSVMEQGTEYFEIEELYVSPEMRSKGLGGRLFRMAEETMRRENVEMICLSTATKNFRAILHFYIDEMGMEFWSARLFKRI